MPTSFRRRLIFWIATSPTCATNFSFNSLVWVQLSQGHRLSSTSRRSDVEGAVHGDHSPGDRGERRAAIQRVGLAREEGRVAFDLDQVEVGGRIDHLLEQAPRGCLRVPEDGAVGLHVLRVAADVGDQEQRTPGLLQAGDATGGRAVTTTLRGSPQAVARLAIAASLFEDRCDPEHA